MFRPIFALLVLLVLYTIIWILSTDTTSSSGTDVAVEWDQIRPPTESKNQSLHGENVYEKTEENPTSKSRIKIDILSIGSQTRPSYLEAQKATWASHWSVRNFFSITELDDQDPDCESKMDLDAIDRCRARFTGEYLNQYRIMPRTWVEKKANPADDDTMYQMKMLTDELEKVDPGTPFVWAGCLTVCYCGKKLRFSPIGGGGMIFSRGAMERFTRQLDCNNAIDTADEYLNLVCAQLYRNVIREKRSWENNSSLTDLIERISNRFFNCFISDHLVGHFVNYYLFAVAWEEEENFNSIEYVPRIHPYQGSFKTLDRPIPMKRADLSNSSCLVAETNEECLPTTPVCHYVNPETMKRVSSQWMR